MAFRKFLLAFVLVVAVASPAQAQYVTFNDASIGYGEGNRNGVVALDLAGNSEVQTDYATMTFDADAGRWVGYGRIDYDGNGVSVHESRAAFSIRVELLPADLRAFCGPTPVPNPSYAAHIEARNAAGELVLVAGAAQNISQPGRCPYWNLTAVVGHNLPASLELLTPRYRDGKGAASFKSKTWGSVKDRYRTATGRIITF